MCIVENPMTRLKCVMGATPLSVQKIIEMFCNVVVLYVSVAKMVLFPIRKNLKRCGFPLIVVNVVIIYCIGKFSNHLCPPHGTNSTLVLAERSGLSTMRCDKKYRGMIKIQRPFRENARDVNKSKVS